MTEIQKHYLLSFIILIILYSIQKIYWWNEKYWSITGFRDNHLSYIIYYIYSRLLLIVYIITIVNYFLKWYYDI